MATVALTKNEKLINSPFLVRRLTLTGGATSANITHGEDRVPDVVSSNIVTESPTVTTVSVARDTSATTMKVDCVGDAADVIEITCTWYNAATGGLNPPA